MRIRPLRCPFGKSILDDLVFRSAFPKAVPELSQLRYSQTLIVRQDNSPGLAELLMKLLHHLYLFLFCGFCFQYILYLPSLLRLHHTEKG